jgi:hypothetical protein
MFNTLFRFSFILFFAFIVPFSMQAQAWEFVKEKDGVKIYTRKDPGKSIKSYKGVADFRAPAEKIFALIEDVNHTEWWDKNLSNIKVVRYEKYKRAQYYLVYELPWPVGDRDLCVDVISNFDPATGVGTVIAGPMPGLVPEKEDLIRIKDYHQTWTVKAAGSTLTHVTLEGSVDPAGSIPDWISNMVIVDSPIKVMSGLRERVEK